MSAADCLGVQENGLPGRRTRREECRQEGGLGVNPGGSLGVEDLSCVGIGWEPEGGHRCAMLPLWA